MSDSALGYDVAFPPLDQWQHEALRAALGPMVALANPLDYHTFIWTDTPAMTATFSAIMLGSEVDMGCIVCDFPREDRCDASAWDCVIDSAEETSRKTGKPLALLATLPDACPEPFAKRIIEAGLIPLLGIDDGLTAIATAAWLGQPKPDSDPLLLHGPGSEDVTVWSEADSKAALAAEGVRVPLSARVEGLEALKSALQRFTYPVVLKGEGFAHKTEAGAVTLNLQSAKEVLTAAEKMDAPAYLIEEMITGGVAELLIGVLRDPAHGFVLTLGAGGVFTEILHDSASQLLPTSDAEIRNALARLKMTPLLIGYRGKPAADLEKIVQCVQSIQSFCTKHSETLEEVEINPLICTPDDAIAVDALIRIGEQP